MTQATKRVPIYCDCCASHVVGYREGDRITWFVNTSKGRHTKVIYLNEDLEHLTSKGKFGIDNTTTE